MILEGVIVGVRAVVVAGSAKFIGRLKFWFAFDCSETIGREFWTPIATSWLGRDCVVMMVACSCSCCDCCSWGRRSNIHDGSYKNARINYRVVKAETMIRTSGSINSQFVVITPHTCIVCVIYPSQNPIPKWWLIISYLVKPPPIYKRSNKHRTMEGLFREN